MSIIYISYSNHIVNKNGNVKDCSKENITVPSLV